MDNDSGSIQAALFGGRHAAAEAMETGAAWQPVLPFDGVVEDHGIVLPAAAADDWLQRLLAEIDWQHDEVLIYGRRIRSARRMAWFADGGLAYRYSGVSHRARAWTPLLQTIRRTIESRLAPQLPVSFNSCLLNHYADGSQGMGWHSDDEAGLGPEPVIASLSLGAARKFVLRHRQSGRKCALMLGHGHLLVMRGSTQLHWQHALMKSTRVHAPRINLTFRVISAP